MILARVVTWKAAVDLDFTVAAVAIVTKQTNFTFWNLVKHKKSNLYFGYIVAMKTNFIYIGSILFLHGFFKVGSTVIITEFSN